MIDDRVMPAVLAEVNEVGFIYREDGGVDFEPYGEFMTAAETTSWWRAWTGNADLAGDAFRVFGQDGTGGMAAFWLVRPAIELAGQPVVFLGSEGETGAVAQDLASYLWLLADGFGPYEAVAYPHREPELNPELEAIAERYAAPSRRSASEVIEAARTEFPDFEDFISTLCR